ncbi:MAG: DUF4493 domain-containing protein [Bacteroidaceae bacterium]|nr:DUF4493 domain-containing protein [Bacteroidaceae bacterium]
MKKIQSILFLMFMAVLVTSCSQDMEIDSDQGYLKLDIKSLVSTYEPNGTRAAVPEGYDAKALQVEIKNQKGGIVKQFNYNPNQNEMIQLPVGTYTIVAHSANWDGNASAFDAPYYYGSTTVAVESGTYKKASLTCTQANVKVTVNYDQSFVENFKSATTTVTSSLSDIAPLAFVMNQTTQSGYIPVGSFEAKLDVVSNNNKSNSKTYSFTDVKARDHYILNFKLDVGNLGDGTGSGVKVEVDETTNTYTYTFGVPRKSAISLATRSANAWSSFAILNAAVTGKTDSFENSGLTIQWKKSGDVDWSVLENSALTISENDEVTATLKGLEPGTGYAYRLCYKNGDTEVFGNEDTFTTEQQTPLYNGGFENWWMDGNVAYANEQGVKFWDTSNVGAASVGNSNTTETTSTVHSGSKAAMLQSKYIVIKFAAASLYTGTFGKLNGTKGASLNWGVSFTSRPTALKGYMQYAPVAINRVGKNLPSDAPAKGETDLCGMFCALLSESLVVDNTDMSTFPDWETDSRVIAYGSLPKEQNVNSGGQWKEVNIPFVYRNLNKKPTHLLIVFSASKYGDYFHGGEGSTLYLDDFSLEYGDAPVVKK